MTFHQVGRAFLRCGRVSLLAPSQRLLSLLAPSQRLAVMSQYIPTNRPQISCHVVHQMTKPNYITTRQLSFESYHRDLTPREFDKLRPDHVVVDVREESEMSEIPPIPGSRNIPLGTLPDHLADLPREGVIFYCRGGVRSLQAVGLAQAAGLTQPQHLAGGIMAWVDYHSSK